MVREIISVNVGVRKADAVSVKADMLAVGMFSDGKAGALYELVDKKLGGAIKKLRKLGDFSGKEKTAVLLYTEGRIGAVRLLLVGLGQRKKVCVDTLRKAAATAMNKAVELKSRSVALALHQDVVGGKGFKAEQLGRAIAEGAYFGAYRYDEYVAGSKASRLKSVGASVVEMDGKVLRKLSTGVKAGGIVGGRRVELRQLGLAEREVSRLAFQRFARARRDRG